MINQITAVPLKQHMYPQRERSDIKVDDQTIKPSQETSLSTESSQRIVSDKVIEHLDKVLQKDHASEIRSLDPKDYTPEAVSKQILNFVRNAIDRAESRGVSRQALFDQASEGIKTGFKQAENILNSLNALSGKIAEGVQQTFELIQTGLGEIAREINPNAVAERSSVSTHSFSSSQEFSLNIVTRDGDQVNLTLQRDQSSNSYQASIENRSGSASANGKSYSIIEGFSLSVNGELDAQEIAAIESLLKDVKSVSDDFFNGNVGAAFDAGLKLGFNTQELSAFSLELNQNQSESVSQAYREISEYGVGHSPTHLDNLLAPIQDFIHSIEKPIADANSSQLFGKGNDAAENLFNFFSRSDESHKPAIEHLEAMAGQPFENITHDIISTIKS